MRLKPIQKNNIMVERDRHFLHDSTVQFNSTVYFHDSVPVPSVGVSTVGCEGDNVRWSRERTSLDDVNRRGVVYKRTLSLPRIIHDRISRLASRLEPAANSLAYAFRVLLKI